MTSAISAGIATEVTDANINEFGYSQKVDHNIARYPYILPLMPTGISDALPMCDQ